MPIKYTNSYYNQVNYHLLHINYEKNVQVAFAVVLFILAIIGSIWKTKYFTNIIFAVIIPSFILSGTSFLEEISIKCGKEAESSSELHNRLAEALKKNACFQIIIVKIINTLFARQNMCYGNKVFISFLLVIISR